ncbi:hypothetical protein FQR65_LT19664 [Abscondita terminalis]|nr:hypothetical protein FQR65_LT19664 [Abscondita terminalis]
MSKLKLFSNFASDVMFLSFYTLIVTLMVQVIKNVNVIECHQYRAIKNISKSAEFVSELSNLLKREVNNKVTTASSKQRHSQLTYSRESKELDDNVRLSQLKDVLQQMLNKLNAMEATSVEIRQTSAPRTTSKIPSTLKLSPISSTSVITSTDSHDSFSDFKKRQEMNVKTKWGAWTSWSTCSVSCGKGRKIRWRHCLTGCDADTEMEEKSCQLPACAPTNFLGIKFKTRG